MVAQSQGGGGGNGGLNVSGAVNISVNESGAAVGIGVGGFGGLGGTGAGNVNVLLFWVMYLQVILNANTGRDAIGVFAQSLGGSGGSGGINVSGALNVALNGTSVPVSLGIGGFGGGGGDAGNVTVNMTGNITTTGTNADGLVVQSQGGGGGIGGLNVSGAVAISNSGESYSAAVGVGGFGGDGGKGGDVYLDFTGSVRTSGFIYQKIDVPDIEIFGIVLPGTGYSYELRTDGSNGILAQSLGGGGGNGGINISGDLSVANTSKGKTGSLVFGMGGFGGGGGDAGNVTAAVKGDGFVIAVGDDRHGIAAESIGGGGGNGGINVSGNVTTDGAIVAGIGGFGGDGGRVPMLISRFIPTSRLRAPMRLVYWRNLSAAPAAMVQSMSVATYPSLKNKFAFCDLWYWRFRRRW